MNLSLIRANFEFLGKTGEKFNEREERQIQKKKQSQDLKQGTGSKNEPVPNIP